jgi:hypothetical protein
LLAVAVVVVVVSALVLVELNAVEVCVMEDYVIPAEVTVAAAAAWVGWWRCCI